MTAWVHTISPFALRLGEDWGLRWYGLAYAAGFLAGWAILRALARRGLVLIPAHRVGDAIIVVALGVIIGGRLGYAVFYRPELFWSVTRSLPWWELLAVHEGGMSSHGGMIGVIVGAWVVSRGWKKEGMSEREGRTPVLHVLDALALVAPVGLFFGRVANFVNAELLGRVVAGPGEPAPWWSVKFPQERLEPGAPDLSLEQQRGLAAVVESVRLPTETFRDGYARLVGEIQSGRPGLADALSPYLASRYPSQLLQAVAEGVVLGVVLAWVWRRPRKPGVVGAWFLVVYGVLRIVTEVWRLPDAHLAVQRPLGLTRGQWLSVAMVGTGVAALAWVSRRVTGKLGGWRTDATPRAIGGAIGGEGGAVPPRGDA